MKTERPGGERFCGKFAAYESIRERLYCRLMDPTRIDGRKEPLLRPWKDLALSCYCDLTEDGLSGVFVTIRRAYLNMWEVTGEQVLAEAWRNTVERKHLLFRSLREELEEAPGQDAEIKAAAVGSPLFLLSDTSRVFGAVQMAVPGVLSEIGRRLGRAYYLLPSSVHECLILPDEGVFTAEELNALVSGINRDHVSEREILADHVYRYDRTQNDLQIC